MSAITNNYNRTRFFIKVETFDFIEIPQDNIVNDQNCVSKDISYVGFDEKYKVYYMTPDKNIFLRKAIKFKSLKTSIEFFSRYIDILDKTIRHNFNRTTFETQVVYTKVIPTTTSPSWRPKNMNSIKAEQYIYNEIRPALKPTEWREDLTRLNPAKIIYSLEEANP